MNKSVSPSRTYVAMCSKLGFDGYFFCKFELPKKVINSTEAAAWYFLNTIDFQSAIDGCLTFEDYSNLRDLSTPQVAKGDKINQNVVIGRIVHYVVFEGKQCPAVIVKVWDDNLVNLQVFNDNPSSIDWLVNVIRDESQDSVGTWHFPERK